MLDCQDHEVCIESASQAGQSVKKGPAFYGTSKRGLRLIWLSHVPAKLTTFSKIKR